MRLIIHALIILVTLSSCKDDGVNPISSNKRIQIVVDFESGFRGDSIVVLSDNEFIIGARGYSDSLNVTRGCIFLETDGLHFLNVVLPIQNTHETTGYLALDSTVTMIDAHYGRSQNKLSYDISYRKFK